MLDNELGGQYGQPGGQRAPLGLSIIQSSWKDLHHVRVVFTLTSQSHNCNHLESRMYREQILENSPRLTIQPNQSSLAFYTWNYLCTTENLFKNLFNSAMTINF